MNRASGIEPLKPFFPRARRCPPGPGGVRVDDQRSPKRLDREGRTALAPRGALSQYWHASAGRHSHRAAAGTRSGFHAHHRRTPSRRVACRHLPVSGQPRGGHYGAVLRRAHLFGPGPGSARRSALEGLQRRPGYPAAPTKHPGFRRHRLGQDHLAQCAGRTAAS